jgi:two-component system NtrC family response regulator
LTKPFTPPELLEVVGRAVEQREFAKPEPGNRKSDNVALVEGTYLQELVRGSPSLKEVAHKVQRVAGFKSTVLVTGESGVGKELVVRAIHELSPWGGRGADPQNGGGPLVAFNCAAVPAGLMESELFGHERGAFTGAAGRSVGYFEAADKGTLFIDEVGELEIGLQAKLLRALETGTITPVGSTREKRVDVRVIAATNSDLAKAVEERRFRDDLYYRLNVVRIDVPPLRERIADLPALAASLLERLCHEHGLKVPAIELGAMEALARYRWPGNVRELRNVLESVLILGHKPVIAEADLPPAIRVAGALDAPGLSDLEIAEKGAIERALKTAAGDRARAAEMLGVSVRTLYRKMGRYGVR